MTLHFQPQTTTHRGALDKEIKRSMKDGVISFPEAERLVDLSGDVPSNHAGKLLARAEKNAAGHDTRAMLLGAIDNYKAGKKADAAIQGAIADRKLTRDEAVSLVSGLDVTQLAVKARLRALLDAPKLAWREGAKPQVLHALQGPPAPLLSTKVEAGIDLSSGKLAHGAASLTLNDDLKVTDPSISKPLRGALSAAAAEAFAHLQGQGSDSYSIRVEVFAVGDNGKPSGFGVWAGAPGDIGDARLIAFDRQGKRVGVIDE